MNEIQSVIESGWVVLRNNQFKEFDAERKKEKRRFKTV